ncbi:MAG TPA: IS1634 family transposase [Nitrospirae bacterium]|nr:IS1634 family transposase [Nitrospirota bacterium]
MFIRVKASGPRKYLQIVENRWEKGKVRQKVIATLGRVEKLKESGSLDSLLRSGARFSEELAIIDSYKKGTAPTVSDQKIGLPMVFERLWKETGISSAIEGHLRERKFRFSVERAVFLTVLHRLSESGSDRAAEKWKAEYKIEGAEGIGLQHLYRAMGWLGEELGEEGQGGATPFVPRCTKDVIEEGIFEQSRDLFRDLSLVFFDTTSIYFEGEGGQEIGAYGNSKDHRHDLKQMVVGIIIDSEGRPICSELWPGNTTDVKTLVPVIERLRVRFGIGKVCIVADRGMISRETIRDLEDKGIEYILGARMRRQKEVKEEVLGRAGRYKEVYAKGPHSKSPSPLKVKEVMVRDKRYIVCYNEDQAKKDAADREKITASLKDKLKQGQKSIVGNKGYRRYLKSAGETFRIDEDKIKEESRYDGKWVLTTNTGLSAEDVALQYKQLWMVEQIFRSMKSILSTRPIYHKCDETIRGHVFCSFLALLLIKELQERLDKKGWQVEWAYLINDLERVKEVRIMTGDKEVTLRTELKGDAGKAFQAVGVAVPPTVRVNMNEENTVNS